MIAGILVGKMVIFGSVLNRQTQSKIVAVTIMTARTAVVRRVGFAGKCSLGSVVRTQPTETGLVVFRNRKIDVFRCKRMESGFLSHVPELLHLLIDTYVKTVNSHTVAALYNCLMKSIKQCKKLCDYFCMEFTYALC